MQLLFYSMSFFLWATLLNLQEVVYYVVLKLLMFELGTLLMDLGLINNLENALLSLIYLSGREIYMRDEVER